MGSDRTIPAAGSPSLGGDDVSLEHGAPELSSGDVWQEWEFDCGSESVILLWEPPALPQNPSQLAGLGVDGSASHTSLWSVF
ncbi:hypothetical protein KOW79_021103 [Hemibagrus wyckioides]|uniref:Uncharacterized protein n=1 Tax=Hemibagrus wyckioides TaxID=337641 RepID=A0A9D3N5R9_9TELE|nr:hypothetical protein KOW79_021103 [Hemibagrus wyckioides]